MIPTLLDPGTTRDIDAQVAKILRGLDNPAPPLRLPDVLELLKLNKGFYSSQDDGMLREVVNRAVIAGKQIVKRPTLLLDAVRKWSIKALYIPDHKRILLDQTEPELKWRWNEAHEIVHSVIPWHADFLHGDTKLTLSRDCHDRLESEANFGAGRLLFLGDQFTEFVQSSPTSFALVKEAQKVFGNTMTSCLWRLVETLPTAAVGIICQHPHYPGADFRPDSPCRYFIQSQSFREEFSTVTQVAAFNLLRGSCSWKKRGPLANEEFVLANDRGEQHLFALEAFNNGFETLALFHCLGPHSLSVVVDSVAASTLSL